MRLHRRNRPPIPEQPTRPSPDRQHLGLLGTLGRGVFRHHRLVALLWLLIIIGAGTLNATFGGKVSDSFTVPGTNSQAAYDLLQTDFPSQNAATATAVFSVPAGQTLDAPANAAAVQAAVTALQAVPGVAPSSVTDPLTVATRTVADVPSPVSADGTIAFTTITFTDSLNALLEQYPTDSEKPATAYPNPYNSLVTAVDSLPASDVTVTIGGPIADTYNNPVSWWANHADEVGLGLGAVLLLIAFGSVLGMAVPIATALFGAITAGGLVLLLADVITVSSAAPKVTLMIAIGVGLDYSLLIVTRYRHFIAEGFALDDAAGLALATAGKASLFAGLTVAVALLGLLLVPIPLVQTLGLAAAIGVGVMILAAITLLPTLLGLVGRRIDAYRLPFALRDTSGDPTRSLWGRFTTRVGRRPWLTLAGGTAVLVLCAWPFLSIDFGMPDDSSLPTSLSQQQAFTLLSEGFGPGANAPIIVVASAPGATTATLTSTLAPLSTALGAFQPAGTVPGVEYSIGPIPNATGDAAVYQIIPTAGPDSQQTRAVVGDLRQRIDTATTGTAVQAYVGGTTATLIDLTDLVVTYLPYVIGAVVIGAFLLLVLVFRSILVPLKAAVMNLISIAAAYGIVVLVFQWGWAKGLLGLHDTIPIVSFVPLIMFVILFGLSMDY
ncbi:MAG: MMPL family transporter, partial [Acidobacteria bacterium]|nr:MMPL family transporter [Acidobacteriota bacterium]